MPSEGKISKEKTIEEILLAGNYVTPGDIAKITALASAAHRPITEVLIQEGVITRNLLGQAVAESLGVGFADLQGFPPDKKTVLLLPEELAQKLHAIVFKQDAKTVIVAADDIKQPKMAETLKEVFKGKKIQLAYAFAEDIDTLFIHYLKALETRFGEIIKKENHIAPEILEQIIADATAFRASDIHLEPQEKEVIIRFRVDGVLHEAGRLPKEYYGNILNRIKVQTHLPIDQHFSAQDGALRYQKGGAAIYMRVSILPTLDGEKVAIRLLSQYIRAFTLSDLGLSESDHARLLQAAQKPFGMILVVGPTGAGKTTSLYALLRIVNRPELNITTIEDPVEYKMPGINQIQVNQQTNLTFASGLRSIARQDPDIILVGEIRDHETADIAVNAALTGHLLLSTFHANDAATAIPRLLEMGTEPFLLASTLQLVVAQRLVRRICDQCKISAPASSAQLAQLLGEKAAGFFPKKSTILYKGKGCAGCGHTGFRGRIAIFEFVVITPEMQNLALTRPSTQQIWKLARTQGSRTLFEDGIEKVKNGVTTLEELLRVSVPPEF